LRNVAIDLADRNYEDTSIDLSKEATENAAKVIFEEHFLGPLGEGVRWVSLRGEFRVKCVNIVLIVFDSYEQGWGTL